MGRLWRNQDRNALGLMSNDMKDEYDFGRRVVDAYEIIEPILMRPAMYFGRPSITAFLHFYRGVSYLGGCGHGGPFTYKLKNDLLSSEGLAEWACRKHEWSGNIDTAAHYLRAAREKLEAENYCVAAVSPHKIEEVGFELFCSDLKTFRNEKKEFVCDVDKCWKKLDKGESFICSRHTGFQRCYYCNKPFDASGPDYPNGIILTDWCCPSCQVKSKENL